LRRRLSDHCCCPVPARQSCRHGSRTQGCWAAWRRPVAAPPCGSLPVRPPRAPSAALLHRYTTHHSTARRGHGSGRRCRPPVLGLHDRVWIRDSASAELLRLAREKPRGCRLVLAEEGSGWVWAVSFGGLWIYFGRPKTTWGVSDCLAHA
jgi:hypothetical protein